MGHGRRDRPGRSRRQRLQLAIGAGDELRGGQNSLAVSEVSDIVAHGEEIARHPSSRVVNLAQIVASATVGAPLKNRDSRTQRRNPAK
jgi:hypothetical protein